MVEQAIFLLYTLFGGNWNNSGNTGGFNWNLNNDSGNVNRNISSQQLYKCIAVFTIALAKK